jgi:hypothetical protein
MQVFTTIYFAEKLTADSEVVENSPWQDREPWAVEHTLRQRIAMHENRNWFENDEPDS